MQERLVELHYKILTLKSSSTFEKKIEVQSQSFVHFVSRVVYLLLQVFRYRALTDSMSRVPRLYVSLKGSIWVVQRGKVRASAWEKSLFSVSALVYHSHSPQTDSTLLNHDLLIEQMRSFYD